MTGMPSIDIERLKLELIENRKERTEVALSGDENGMLRLAELERRKNEIEGIISLAEKKAREIEYEREKKATKAANYGLFKDWAFIEAQNKYYDLTRGLSVSAQAFRVRWDGHPEVIENGKSNAVAYASRQNIRTVYDTMFWPGKSAIFNHGGASYINTYKAPVTSIISNLSAGQQKAADSFYTHLKTIFPLESDRTIALDWMAWLIQNQHGRINYALLIKGTEGDGKSYLASVMKAATGSVVQVSGSSIGGQFTGWAHGSRIVAVEEVRVSGEKKYESLDRMKPLITNDEIPIEEKGRDSRTVPNHSSYMLFTNHADAMPIGSSDRRYAVLETRFDSQEQLFQHHGGPEATADYFENLYGLLKDFPEVYSHVLLSHKISESFRPKGNAPHTQAKARMLEAAKPESQRLLEEAIEKHFCDRVSDDLLDVTLLGSLCSDGFGNMTTPLPHRRAMAAALRDMGYKKVERRIKHQGVSRYIWYNHMVHDESSAEAFVRKSLDNL